MVELEYDSTIRINDIVYIADQETMRATPNYHYENPITGEIISCRNPVVVGLQTLPN